MVIFNCKNGANKILTINKWLKIQIKGTRNAHLVFARYILLYRSSHSGDIFVDDID